MILDRSPTPILRMVEGDAPGRAFDLSREKTVLGRAKDNGIVLPAETVSKKHAEIRRHEDGFVLVDLKSRNRTQVNGTTIRAEAPTPLRDGDKITICEFSFVFHNPAVSVQNDDEGTSTILGSIEVKSSLHGIGTAKPEEKLPAILEISGAIGNTLSLREVLEKTLGSLFTIFPQAERGFVLLRQGEQGELVPQAIRYRDEEKGRLTLSQTVFSHVMNEGRAILSTNVPNDSTFTSSKSLHDAEIRTMMCVPLLDPKRVPVGMIQLDSRNQKSRFGQEDLDLLVAVAGPIGLAIENSRLHTDIVRLSVMEAELRHAHDVQMALLPEKRPDVPGYQFWDAYEPAQSVGGDYFDYFPMPARGNGDKVWAITLGDVSGKGMPAALLMAKLASEVRMLLLTEPDPAKAVERLNRQLLDSRFPDRFITFVLVLLDTGSHTLTVVNAGHMGPLIRRANGTAEVVGETRAGPPLAILDDVICGIETTTLSPGDIVVLYTDGVSEAMDSRDRIFKFDRLRKTVLAAGNGADIVGEAILKAVRLHCAGAEQSDDIGLVCFTRL